MKIFAKTEGVLLEELTDIFEPILNQKGIQVFIHGSWADNTRTAFSDLDDFIIIDNRLAGKELELLQTRLDEIELRLQRIDPLQHHGHWIINKQDLYNYNNSYIPLFILNESIAIVGDPEIEAFISKQSSIKGLLHNIVETCKQIETYCYLLLKDELNIYQLKCLVGSFALLPALIFQLKGRNLNKKNALGIASDLFSDKSCSLINWATDLRANWEVITNSSAYFKFISVQNSFTSASAWREYAFLSAPVMDYSSMSNVILTDNLVRMFINEVLIHVDSATFQKKEIIDYTEAYKKIESEAKINKAVIIGQFGSIKWPSISDMDVLICFPDQNYKEGVKAIDKIINEDENLSYLFTHSPVYISISMLPYIKYFHTLYNLNITFNATQRSIEGTLDDEFIKFRDLVWAFFFMQLAKKEKIEENIKYISLRYLVLILKNLHKSIDNLNSIANVNSSVVDISEYTRKEICLNGISARPLIEKNVISAIRQLEATASTLSSTIKLNYKIFVAGRNVLFIADNSNKTKYLNGKTYFYLQPIFFDLFYNLIFKKNNAALTYVKVNNFINSLIQSKVIESNPFINPLSSFIFVPLRDNLKGKLKIQFFNTFNKLPPRFIKFFFEVL